MTQRPHGHHHAANHTHLIRKYFACFNERRFDDAAALFTPDAVLEQAPFHSRERGGAAYLLFARTWTRAFPDAVMSIQRIVERPPDRYEIEILATGTHRGDLAMGACKFRPTGVSATLHLRELLELQDEHIAGACLSFDFQELVHELVRIDETTLLSHLERIRALEAELRATEDATRRRELFDLIGLDLDAARRAVRPYFVR